MVARGPVCGVEKSPFNHAEDGRAFYSYLLLFSVRTSLGMPNASPGGRARRLGSSHPHMQLLWAKYFVFGWWNGYWDQTALVPQQRLWFGPLSVRETCIGESLSTLIKQAPSNITDRRTLQNLAAPSISRYRVVYQTPLDLLLPSLRGSGSLAPWQFQA
jgi:hypothetical protein